MSQANDTSTGVTHPAQGQDCEITGLHSQHYRSYVQALAILRALNGDETEGSEDRREAAFAASDEAFDDLMECPSDCPADLLFKIKAAQHFAICRTEGSTMSPRVFGELLAIMAADLEILLAGKAVRS